MDNAEIRVVRSAAIDRIMLEFEKCDNRLDEKRTKVREILRFNWGVSPEVYASTYFALPEQIVNFDSCQTLLGSHGHTIWRVMKVRYEQR